MIFLKNTWKYDIFFKCSEKDSLSKKIILGHDPSCIIRKGGILFLENFFYGRKLKDDFY